MDGGYILWQILGFALLMVGVAVAWFAVWTVMAFAAVAAIVVFLLLLPSIVGGFRDGWRDGHS
jgi:hypothetical protein